MALLVLLALPAIAQAGLTVSLAPASQAAAPGADLVFSGLLTNTSGTDKLFLNDLQATLTGAAASNVTVDANTFFANVPGILLPGETYHGPLFRLTLSASAAAANYSGSIAFLGGTALRDFGEIIFIGIVVGTFSSIFIASPIVLWWSRRKGVNIRDDIRAAVAKAEAVSAAP